MDGAEGAYPAAEKPAENNGQDNGGKTPQQSSVEGAGCLLYTSDAADD